MNIQPKKNQTDFDEFNFESIFQSSPYGMLIISQSGEIIMVNPQIEDIFGYNQEELLHHSLDILLPINLRKTHGQHMKKFFQNPSSRMMGNRDLFGIHKDGREISVEIKLNPIHYQNMGMVVLASIIDISQRKKVESELKKLTEKLEDQVQLRTEELSQAIAELLETNKQLNVEMEKRKKAEEEAWTALEKEKDLSKLKSRFVSMASHEFRTPLAGILTSASLIDRYSQQGNQDRVSKHIETVKNSVKSLTMILNDFLSIDKLEAGIIECRPVRFNLEEFLEDFKIEIQTLSKSGQDIVIENHGNIELFTDRDILRNILINLISNAIKYSPEKSKIEIISKVINNELIIDIKDEGIGIPEEDQKYLFKRFFRAHNATAIQGTGLGLNIVSRYLTLLGGAISYQSQEGKGSIFTVKLSKENFYENNSSH